VIKLLTAATPNGQRAALILEECGLDYKVKTLDLMRGDQREPSFLKLNPRGQIPVVVDDEGAEGKPLVLTQSSAILMHYAMTHGVLWPDEPGARALAVQWTMQATSDMSCNAATLFALTTFVPERTESTIDYFLDRLDRNLAYVDRHLAETAYLAGPASIADLALYPVIAGLKEKMEVLGGFDHIDDWAARMVARPAVARGMQAHTRS